MTFCTLRLLLRVILQMHARMRAACIQKHATLVCICGSYLWPASLPKEPVVRRGLEGLTQLGSGVFCTSVLTSGSISEGEGVSFAPAMALCLDPRVQSPAESCQYASSSWCQSRQAHAEKTRIPRFTGAACRWRGSACFPAASRAPQTH